MTDSELARLIQEKTPEELSSEELAALRARLPHSEELRAALADQLRFEAYMNDVLGGVHVPVEAIVSGAARPPGGGGRAWLLLLVLLLGVSAFAALLLDPTSLFEAHRVARSPSTDSAAPEPARTGASDDELPAAAMPASAPVDETASVALAPAVVVSSSDASSSAAVAVVPLEADGAPGDAGDSVSAAGDSAESSVQHAPRGLVSSAPPRPFTELCFEEFTGEDLYPLADDLERWLAAVDGHPRVIKSERRGERRVARLDGVFRLDAEWSEDALLRFDFDDAERLRLHLWRGERGVSLWAYERGRRWAVYATTRSGRSPLPASHVFLADDSERARRTGGGPLTVRFESGRVLLSRGDAVLLEARCDGAPGDAVLECEARVRGLRMERFEIETIEPGASAVGVVDGVARDPLGVSLETMNARPAASLHWRERLPRSPALAPLAAGAAELRVAAGGESVHVSTPIPVAGPCEIVCELAHVTPGAGVFLGDRDGEPVYGVGFVLDKRSGSSSLAFVRPGESREVEEHPDERPTRVVGERVWVKLLAAGTAVQVFRSDDGRFWSRALEPMRRLDGIERVETLGVWATGGDAERRIEVRRIAFRALADVVTDELVARAPQRLASGVAAETWEEIAERARPPDAGAEDWRAACALRWLREGAPTALAHALLESLAERVVALEAPPARLSTLLSDVALLADTWRAPFARVHAERLHAAWVRLGERLREERGVGAWSAVGAHLLELPLWVEGGLDLLPDRLVRAELLDLVHAGRSEEVLALCRRVEFYGGEARRDRARPEGRRGDAIRLVDWASAVVAAEGGAAAVAPSLWRHPVRHDMSKDAYNALAEFRAALDGEAYRDACDIITSPSRRRALGLLPSRNDPQLLRSFESTVDIALEESAELRRVMREEFGPRGELRAREAMAQGDVAGVRAAVLQFPGTASAAAASAWLGDHALACGDFVTALARYRDALRGDDGLERASLGARARLAASLLGRDEGEALSGHIVLGEDVVAAPDLEAIVAEMRGREPRRDVSRADDELPALDVPLPDEPLRYRVTRRGAFASQTRHRPRKAPDIDVDWFSRDLSVTFAAGRMLVGERLRFAAYGLDGGEPLWSRDLHSDKREYDWWPPFRMRPWITDEHLYVRLFSSAGPELHCIDLARGRTRWRARPPSYVASDPVMVHDALLALIARYEGESFIEISLGRFAPDDGRLLGRQRLFVLHDVLEFELDCQIALRDDRLLIVAAGCVASCDTSGRLEWLRRQAMAPASTDERWLAQFHEPPLARDGVLWVTQPGVRSVECIESATGRLVWRRVSPNLERLVALTGPTLVVQTADGVQALDARSGRLLWTRAIADVLDMLCSSKGGVLLACSTPDEGRRGGERVRLRWLDLASGGDRGATLINGLQGGSVCCLLAASGERLWAFASGAANDESRDILELSR